MAIVSQFLRTETSTVVALSLVGGQMAVVFRTEQSSPSLATHHSNSSISELDRSRSKTISNTNSAMESENASIQPTGFNFLQSIKDLTHQELNRANPLGLLGKRSHISNRNNSLS